jgi:hypothetical protein
MGPELQRYDVFLDQLSEKAHRDLCWRTAERLSGGNKGQVKAEKVVQVPDWRLY